MRDESTDERRAFLSQLPARTEDRRRALAVIAVSTLIFAATVPFARVQWPAVWAFIPSYQSALAVNDLVTAALLYGQFATLRSRALLALAAGYLFTALMAVIHTLTFPGLFAPTGLLGAGPQSTAWLYMFWHGGFPLLVIAYAALKSADGRDLARGSVRGTIAVSILAVSAAAAGLAFLATAGHQALPAIMQGNNYTPAMIGVVSSVWVLSLAALAALWLRRPHSVLDLWLMVVMCAWLFDIALAAVLNAGRFDVGFYVGRIYGLMAASFVLVVLLLETGALYAQLARLFEVERAQAAAEISRVNAQLRTVLDSSPLPIFSLDAQGALSTWNSAAERVFGYAAADIVGRSFASLPENAHNACAALHRRVMAGECLQNVQMQWLARDGHALDIALSGAPVRDGSQPSGAVYVAEDVTENKKLERQLAQSQKMEAVGQLTGGIAHDFNNLLTVITGTIETLQDGVADRPKLAAIAKVIDEAATRGAELTRHLLAFARKQPLQPRETDINELVTAAAKLLHATLGEHVEIETVLARDARRALVDPSQLTSAVVNLAINARDAMPGGGKLTIETRNVVLDETYASQHSEVAAGPYVMIAISDTGVGIPTALRERVFEPFFTTKEVGKGTGLGLSMVFGFLKQSGGHIKIYSEEGHGTTVKMYLPRAGAAMTEAAEVPVAPHVGGQETVLVVEDDTLVRNNVVMQLESLGYRTLAAATGIEALALINQGERIDLLFTDVVMPGGLNGRQLAEQAIRDRPAIKVLFTSGYTDNAIVHHGRLDPGVLLLGKPYRKADLARMVRTALG